MSRKLKSILTGQGHIREVIVRSELSEGRADILLEVFPVEAKFFRRSVHLWEESDTEIFWPAQVELEYFS